MSPAAKPAEQVRRLRLARCPNRPCRRLGALDRVSRDGVVWLRCSRCGWDNYPGAAVPCAFDPIGCAGPLGSTGPGTARCACGWLAPEESPDRPAAFAAWLCHTGSVPSHREQLGARMADDERHADHGHDDF